MGKKRNRRGKKHKTFEGLSDYTYGQFLGLFPLCTEESKSRCVKVLNNEKRPDFLNGNEVPANLNGITYGQLDDLSRAKDANDPFVFAFDILMNMDSTEVYKLPVTEVFGFGNFVTSEIDRINKLFASIALPHTPEEISAGITELNFGSFGVLDWYARRMGITNQNEVRSVPWVRIYTCMKNDTAQAAYERRYNQVILNNSKSRRR